jgi:hypothetical protein
MNFQKSISRAGVFCMQATMLAALTGSAAAQQAVLILCPPEGTCTLQSVAALNIDGKNKLRLLNVTPETIAGPVAIKASRQIKVAEIPGAIIRNSKTGVISIAPWTGRAMQVVLPPNVGKAESVDAAAIWKNVSIDYKESPSAKQRRSIQEGTFAGLLVDADSARPAIAMAKGLLLDQQFPRRADLIRGATEFAKESPEFQEWRAEISGEMTKALNNYLKKSGEPSQLVSTLEQGLQASAILDQISHPNPDELKVQERLRKTYGSLQQKAAIAKALGTARFWDEFVAKLAELDLQKWSFPDLVKLEPSALRQASEAHLKKARSLENQGMLDRSLDEALLAYHQLPCDAGTRKYLKHAQEEFLDKNNGLESRILTPAKRKELDRFVNELDGSAQERPEYVLEQIHQGPEQAPLFAPLQMLKAKSLKRLDRLTEAAEVMQQIARDIPLEPAEKKEWIKLDGDIHAALEDELNKTRSIVARLMDEGKYDEVVKLCTRSLTMDPEDFDFLDKQVRAAALLNNSILARERTIWRMEHGNTACAGGPALESLLALSIASTEETGQVRHHTVGGIKHWITGEEYAEGSAYYDPLSLGFLPRVQKVVAEKVEETFFDWREFQLALVETKPFGQTHATFSAEPQYAPGSVRMTAIGERGSRTPYSLTYLNTPGRNVKLLAKEKHRPVARGWAPNPFFHPFYWKKIYLFDLTYDDKDRVVKAEPVTSDDNQQIDRNFSQTLEFAWEGGSNRLLSITGDRGYKRVLKYDGKSRLVEEKITDPKGNGSIHYEYAGSKLVPRAAVCVSNFYEKHRKKVEFRIEE